MHIGWCYCCRWGWVKWKGHNCYFFVHVLLLYIHFDTHSKVTMANICIIVMKYEWDASVCLPEGFHWTWWLCLCPSPEYFCFSSLLRSNFDYATCIFSPRRVYTYLHVFLFCINGAFLPVSIQCYSGFFWLFFLLTEKNWVAAIPFLIVLVTGKHLSVSGTWSHFYTATIIIKQHLLISLWLLHIYNLHNAPFKSTAGKVHKVIRLFK